MKRRIVETLDADLRNVETSKSTDWLRVALEGEWNEWQMGVDGGWGGRLRLALAMNSYLLSALADAVSQVDDLIGAEEERIEIKKQLFSCSQKRDSYLARVKELEGILNNNEGVGR